MDLQLQGKTAVVTGASMGLGRATAKALALEGVKVLAVARSADLLQELSDEIEAAGGVKPVIFEQDFVTKDASKKIAAKAFASLGQIDILVNNAGGSRPISITAGDDVWEEGMTLNFDRHRQLTQEILPYMIERKSGRLIHISGTQEPDHVNAAAVAKAGLVVWSKGLSHQIGKYGITSNCIEPGLLDTQQIRKLFPGDARRIFAEREISLGDFGDPIEVAKAAVFLASAAASYITGIVLPVDGGMRNTAF
ncbi:MAG TPA: SDR family oxidoreductase [Oxalicibacterium sp.]